MKFKEWCSPEDFSVSEIYERTNKEVENFKTPDSVYISLDLYSILLKQLAGSMQYSATNSSASLHINEITTSYGTLTIHKLPTLRQFCKVCINDEWRSFCSEGIDQFFLNDQERIKINQEFEDIVLGDNNET